MARLPYVYPDDLPPQYRDMFRNNANITRALANSPEVAKLSGAVARYIREGNKLDPRLRELAIIQVGYTANSPYEYTHHIEIGLRYGVTESDLHALADEAAGRDSKLDPLAKTVLRAAREITANGTLSDATFAALKQGLDNERLIELIFAISNYNGVVRMLAALQVDLEDEYRPYLEKFPIKT
jgi:alkylhydroperoxidase family enzyme